MMGGKQWKLNKPTVKRAVQEYLDYANGHIVNVLDVRQLDEEYFEIEVESVTKEKDDAPVHLQSI